MMAWGSYRASWALYCSTMGLNFFNAASREDALDWEAVTSACKVDAEFSNVCACRSMVISALAEFGPNERNLSS